MYKIITLITYTYLIYTSYRPAQEAAQSSFHYKKRYNKRVDVFKTSQTDQSPVVTNAASLFHGCQLTTFKIFLSMMNKKGSLSKNISHWRLANWRGAVSLGEAPQEATVASPHKQMKTTPHAWLQSTLCPDCAIQASTKTHSLWRPAFRDDHTLTLLGICALAHIVWREMAYSTL